MEKEWALRRERSGLRFRAEGTRVNWEPGGGLGCRPSGRGLTFPAAQAPRSLALGFTSCWTPTLPRTSLIPAHPFPCHPLPQSSQRLGTQHQSEGYWTRKGLWGGVPCKNGQKVWGLCGRGDKYVHGPLSFSPLLFQPWRGQPSGSWRGGLASGLVSPWGSWGGRGPPLPVTTVCDP